MALAISSATTRVSSTSAQSVTTASFNVTAGQLLLACTATAYTTSSITDSAGGTWTLASGFGTSICVYRRQVTSNGSLTVTFTHTNAASKLSLSVWAVTGHDQSSPVGGTGSGSGSTVNNITPTAFTSTVSGSLLVASAYDVNSLGTPSSSDLTYTAGANPASMSGYKTLGAPGSQTVNFDAYGSSNAQWYWCAAEIKPAIEATPQTTTAVTAAGTVTASCAASPVTTASSAASGSLAASQGAVSETATGATVDVSVTGSGAATSETTTAVTAEATSFHPPPAAEPVTETTVSAEGVLVADVGVSPVTGTVVSASGSLVAEAAAEPATETTVAAAGTAFVPGDVATETETAVTATATVTAYAAVTQVTTTTATVLGSSSVIHVTATTVTAAGRAAVPVTVRSCALLPRDWVVELIAGDWSVSWEDSMGDLHVDRDSLEWVSAAVEGDNDPTGDTVEFSFPVGARPLSWTTGEWGARLPDGRYRARCLVGPGGGVELSAGRHRAFLRITDVPTVPVQQLDDVIVT